ncbi:MAG: hypothetical protein ACLFQB_10650 [Chitinispirillaceae bacterium]
MESAALVLTALAIVVILQIITIALVLSNKKKNRTNTKNVQPMKSSGNPRNDKRDNNRRHNKKSHQDNRSRSHQHKESSSSIDPVEKSLRDINLKLKNAEKDQENVRRKIQDTSDSGNSGSNNRNDRRSNRKNHNRRDNRRNNNDRRNRDSSRSNYKNSDGAPEKNDSNKNRTPEKAPEPSVPETKPNTPELVPNDLGVSEENLQHGRKFNVKRRQLKESASDQGAESVEDVISKDDKIEVEFDARPEESEIKFGRR